MKIGCSGRLTPMRGLRLALTVILSFGLVSHSPAQTPSSAPVKKDNGIHVGAPKVYDSRELTLMLDNLSQALQNQKFVDPKALASALGNMQGYQNSSSSQSLFANGAVGPQAASVFAGAAGLPTAPVTSISPYPTPTFSTAPSTVLGTGLGPQAPSLPTLQAPPSYPPTFGSNGSDLGPQATLLPTLQAAPSYPPTFGSNGSDLLSDEVNLTYQLYNVRMLLDRSLTDRLYGKEARLQAVVGFDVDLEPDRNATDAAAVVEITVEMSSPAPQPECEADGKLSLVALMPEEGSHNAATLSQKAKAFGGAIAASVFSAGFSTQKLSQVFYVYRDMDTVSFQTSASDAKSIKFGWQFRPVLGRRSVDPGMRHMIAVLGLPCSDEGAAIPLIRVNARAHWERYDGETQTTSRKTHFWARSLPGEVSSGFDPVEVPPTDSLQSRLGSSISKVIWTPTDANNGVATVTGKNFFPGTTVRLGGKTYSNAADGLTIKSDHELEVAVPLAAAAVGGVLSGRYGQATPLQSPTDAALGGFALAALRLYPLGNYVYEVVADLLLNKDGSGHVATLQEVRANLNSPVALVNGVPLPGLPLLSQALPSQPSDNPPIELTMFVPASTLAMGAPVFTVTFPFEGAGWTSSLPYYETTLKVLRLGNDRETRLFISVTNPAERLCSGWALQLSTEKKFTLLEDTAPIPATGGLKCADPKKKMLSLDIPSKDLNAYHTFILVNSNREPLIGAIPPAYPPPPGPSLDKDQKVSVSQNDVRTVMFTGKHLDQVTKVLFDTAELRIVDQADTEIVISLSPQVTSKARDDVELQLTSDGNSPLIAVLSVTPTKKGNDP